MQWTAYVLDLGEMKNTYLKRRDGLDDVGIHGEMELIEIPWEGVDGVGRVATSFEHK
jgi:hypothetical protein